MQTVLLMVGILFISQLPLTLLAQTEPEPAPATTTSSEPTAPPKENSDSNSSSGDADAATVVAIPTKTKNDNCFYNGDLENGKSGWKGNCSIIERNGEKALSVDMRLSDLHMIIGTLKFPSRTKKLTVYFQIELDPEAKPKYNSPVRMAYVMGMVTYYMNVKLRVGKSRLVCFDIDVPPSARQMPLSFEILQGTGTLYLSKFVAEATPMDR